MYDQGDAHGLERGASEFRALCRGGCGKRFTADMGEIYPAFLYQLAVAEHAGEPATPGRALPAILNKGLATIFPGQCSTDVLLQGKQVVLNLADRYGTQNYLPGALGRADYLSGYQVADRSGAPGATHLARADIVDIIIEVFAALFSRDGGWLSPRIR